MFLCVEGGIRSVDEVFVLLEDPFGVSENAIIFICFAALTLAFRAKIVCAAVVNTVMNCRALTYIACAHENYSIQGRYELAVCRLSNPPTT